jgi:hypothetical protein
MKTSDSPIGFKYRTRLDMFLPPTIERIPFYGESESSVIASTYNHDSPRRHPKITLGICFYDTWGEAHSALKASIQSRVDEAQRNLDRARSYLDKIKEMKNPAREDQ